MNKSINNFYRDQNLMDSKIMSSLGLTDKDIDLVRNNDNILDFYGTHSIDANLTNMGSVVRFTEYDNENNINKFIVKEGRLPEKSGEIALDERAVKLNKDIKIGDEYVIDTDKDTIKSFKKTTFKIVGIVKSPMYLEKETRGVTSVGKGTIDYFAVLNSSDISMDVYTEIYLRFKNVQGLDAYGDEYKQKMEQNNKYLENLYSGRVVDRFQEVKSDVQKEFDKAHKEIKDNEEKLLLGEREIINGKEKIEEVRIKLNQAKVQLDKAKQEFLNQGIDPDKNTTELEYEVENLKKLISSIDLLSNDIKDTVKNIKEDEEIPSEKVQYWKGIISNLGLSDISGLINELEKNPKNIGIAINIFKSLDSTREALSGNLSKLQLLVNGITEYQKGKSQYEEYLKILSNGGSQIENAQNELDKSEKKLIDGEKEINENKVKILDAKKEVDEKEKESFKKLDKSKYYFFDRNDNPGYSGYKDSIKSLNNIASVIPVFFFLVAVMICLTTMTRMVEENRIEIGTLKALGYGDLKIAWKFIIYAALASISGSILGILIGCSSLPLIIGGVYESLYSLPALTIYYYPSYAIQSIIISILCTVGAAMFVIRIELKSKPSNLMKAKAPKIGKKILLERITSLWKRLSFNHKVTFRNIFRYKERMIMTVLGIAGCMSMLVTGFGIKNSNIVAIDRQFEKLWKYDAVVVFSEDFTEKEHKEYQDTLNEISGYENNFNIHQEPVTFNKDNMNKQMVTLYVPEDKDKINDFILLNNRASGDEYEISDDGVIINEKLAKLLGVSTGDTISMKDEDNNSYDVKVDKIAENYIMHQMYMSPSYYEKIFNKKAIYNTQLLNFDKNKEVDDEITSKLMECDNVINVTLTPQLQKSAKEVTDNMNLVMLIIILVAGCLSFTVLFNLNNINVSERIRELSTIKVLGFFDNEVTMYILRENIILTSLGILSGSLLGKLLHVFVIGALETDSMMIYPGIYISSYIFSALITILFTVIVMVIMHIKLKNVNMIDALKSNE